MAINKTAKMLTLGTVAALGSMTAQAADKELLDMPAAKRRDQSTALR